MSCRPGSKNSKADVLTWRYKEPASVSTPEFILAQFAQLAVLQTDIEEVITAAHIYSESPSACSTDYLPPNRPFAPSPSSSETLVSHLSEFHYWSASIHW